MAFKLNGASPDVTKMYLFPTADGAAVGSRHFEYVTTDAPATVAGAGYIDNTTADGEIAVSMLNVGDLVWAWQVSAIDDELTISEDKANGVTAVSLHAVLVNDGTAVNLSDDLLAATVTGES